VVNHTITAQLAANKTEEGSELVLNDLVNVGKCPVQQAHSSLYACFSIYICLLFGLCYIHDIINKLYYKIMSLFSRKYNSAHSLHNKICIFCLKIKTTSFCNTWFILNVASPSRSVTAVVFGLQEHTTNDNETWVKSPTRNWACDSHCGCVVAQR
jgi:hypothetical protein